MSTFSDPQAVARYAEAPLRQVPGFLALQQMTRLLLAEHVPAQGRVLVLGAGGGLELKAFAEAQPGWQLLGVDPAAPMLALAEQTLGPLMPRVQLLEGYIDDAPDLRFDGASCLLTLHFLDAAQLHAARLHSACSPAHRWWWRTTACRRIRPASCAGCSATPRSPKPRGCPRRCTARDRRHCRAVAAAGPEQEVALMQEAGFDGVELFYAGFSFKGWVAYAG